MADNFSVNYPANVVEGGGGEQASSIILQCNVAPDTYASDRINANSYYGFGTQFEAAETGYIGNVSVTRMGRGNSPVCNLQVLIYSGAGPTDGSDFSPGDLLGSSEKIAAGGLSLGPDFQSQVFNFATPIAVTVGETYCMVIIAVDITTLTATHYVTIFQQDGGVTGLKGGYADGAVNTWYFDDINLCCMINITS